VNRLSESTDRLRTFDVRTEDDPIDLEAGWRAAGPADETVRRRQVRDKGCPGAVKVEPEAMGAVRQARLDARTLDLLASPRAAIQPLLLTRAVPVGLLRRGLAAAYSTARAAGDSATVARVKAAAATVDARRSALIERLLSDCFQNFPDLEPHIVAMVEGGATRGDPEYQGIFGDVDFTVFTQHDPRALRRVSEAICTSFAWTGYPLTPGGQNRALDLHVFVQYAGRPGSDEAVAAAAWGSGSAAAAAGIVRDLPLRRQIGARNPERFVSDVGLRWIVNQMYYSGRPLRGRVERACVPERLSACEAPAFAGDVLCHMSSALLSGRNGVRSVELQDASRQELTSALNETKHVLRLVDAWLISHPLGNRLYHDRFVQPRHLTRGNSYHDRVVRDAVEVIRAGRAGSVLGAADEPLLRRLGALKQRKRYPSPWDVIGYGDAAQAEAAALVGETRRLVNRLLRKLLPRPGAIGQVG
jgi:hypothetical protein